MMTQERRRRMRDIEAVMSLLRQELAPLRQAIVLILRTLHLDYQLPPISIICNKRSKKSKKQKSFSKNTELSDLTSLDGIQGIIGIDDIELGGHICQQGTSESVLARKEQVVVPRGNNTRFKAQKLPEQPPQVTKGVDEWERLWKQMRRLVDGKLSKGERGWFDFEKKMLVELIEKGRVLGADVVQVTLLLGLSPTTLKRWRINLCL